MGAHTTSDDPTKYRVSAEVEMWKLRDPIARLKAYLDLQRQGRPGVLRRGRARGRRAGGAGAARAAWRCPTPRRSSMFDHIYVEEHPLVEAERAEFAAYAASFEGSH